MSENVYNSFDKTHIGQVANLCQGLTTTDNNKYVRAWTEVSKDKIGFSCSSLVDAKNSKNVWFPFNKGGSFRKWYGNNDLVVNYFNDGEEIKSSVLKKYTYLKTPDFVVKNTKYYFKECLTWSALSSGNFSIRYSKQGAICADKGQGLFAPKDLMIYSCGLLNSAVAELYLSMISPTLDYNCGYIRLVPFINCEYEKSNIEKLVNQNICLSKTDWDSFETSWDFKVHPLVELRLAGASTWGDNAPSARISSAYKAWSMVCEERFNQLKANEEELNRIFIDIYGLQDELTPEVEDKDVTVRKADLVRDIKSFISYAVGCMFGRYSLDIEGLSYAGGAWDDSKYTTFIPDTDDIIPICDEEYFEDDIVSRFIEFVSVVYGSDTLEENLKFIADVLGGKGTPREVLRNYFLNDLFKDHCNTYQVTGSGKRPIYWLFDSGKKNGFKALVYIHRYTPDLIARMRTGYIHPQQARYRTQIELLQEQIDMAGSTSEKVKLSKQLKKINEQLLELNKYEEIVHHWADKMEPMDLDDGVKVNYEKFKELLAKIK